MDGGFCFLLWGEPRRGKEREMRGKQVVGEPGRGKEREMRGKQVVGEPGQGEERRCATNSLM